MFVKRRITAMLGIWILAGTTTPCPARALGLSSMDQGVNPLLPSPHLDFQVTGVEAPPSPGQVPSHRAYVAPVLLSALVPGLGEISIGHWKRGVPLVALDAATWILFANYRSDGYDSREQYEAFADKYWHYTGDVNGNGVIDAGSEIPGWQENLHTYYDGIGGPNYDYWDPNSPYNCNCPYIPKEEDKQHYYENIGKYLYYYPGWEDWEWRTDVPPDVAAATSDSRALRAQYASMRQDSNASFDHATAMVVVAMLTRVGSMIQSALLVRSDLHRLELQPVRTSGRGTGMRLAWRY